MYTLYTININGYGIYVSHSINSNKDINNQYRILNNNSHHCLPLQLLWNLYPDLFSTKIILTDINISLLNIVSYAYRKKLTFSIDSIYRSELVTSTTISRRYNKYYKIYIQRDFNNLVYIFDEYNQQIGLEVAYEIIETGWYKPYNNYRIRKLL